MKNFIQFVLTALLVPSCVLLERPVGMGRSRNETVGERQDKMKDGNEEATDTSAHLYLAVVEYPKDYDWVRDTAHSYVDARLLLFKDGECTVTIPAGDAWHVSTDPDTHWILGGSLYTTFSDGSETYILKDGRQLHRFSGSEDIKGMLLQDGMLWTLGQKLRGEGFVLRCDGVAVVDNAQGSLIGSLYEDDGDLCFAYGMTVKAGNYSINKYFLSAGGKENEVSIPSDATAVFDIRRIGRIPYATYRQASIPVGPVLSSSSGSRSLGGKAPNGALYPDLCTIIPWGDQLLVKGWYNYKNATRMFTIWKTEGVWLQYNTQIAISDLYTDPEQRIAAVGYDRNADESVLYLPPSGTSRVSLGRRYRFISHKAAAIIGGRLYAGLSGDGENLLCIDRDRTTIKINGPITALAYQ